MRFFLVFLLYWVPMLVLAANGGDAGSITQNLNFAPPATDYSVIFLRNIFGTIEGIFFSTGSQMLGQIFGVFNSAVMALGGILIMYTSIVSTMNTAHEGQFLGQKWSSIWVPVRSVAGISLLVPKASGYCMIQVFVMWVVIQGVGAADKVWNAALGYLNQGGVIVQPQMNSLANPLNPTSTGLNQIQSGAYTILQAQVCMYTIEQALRTIRSAAIQNAQQSSAGICYEPPANSVAEAFCNTAVPSFIDSVNAVAYQEANPAQPSTAPASSSTSTTSSFSVKMPNFASGLYANINGICGSLTWNTFTSDQDSSASSLLSAADAETVELTRAMAVQQMYQGLAVIARTIVNNIPYFQSPSQPQNTQQTSVTAWALHQFGIPLTSAGKPCKSVVDQCVSWGIDSTLPNGSGSTTANSAVLFNGTEFNGAVTAYNNVMLPALRLFASSSKSASSDRQFIQTAESSGWIMAGSYFFDIVQLNANTMSTSTTIDTNSGLNNSTGPTDMLALAEASCVTAGGCTCNTLANLSQDAVQLCTLVSGQLDFLANMQGLLYGVPQQTTLNLNSPVTATSLTLQAGQLGSTVQGLVENSLMMPVPGQPGQTPPKFALKLNLQLQTSMLALPSIHFPCGKSSWFVGCLGNMLAGIFYNMIIVTVYNAFIQVVTQLINSLVQLILIIPIEALANIFITGVATIEYPTVNPIVALANMGVMYINFSTNLWLDIMMVSMVGSLVPWFGLVVYMLLLLIMPILGTWLAIMTGIGFTTAYYVPFLPYMIFTFGSIAWLMAVVEAMVAAPIVALGVSSPEGDQAFGKAEPAIMLIMSVFLRPAMMIIGYIAAIAMSYVSVWVINAGFANAMVFIQGNPNGPAVSVSAQKAYGSNLMSSVVQPSNPAGSQGGVINPDLTPGAAQAGEMNMQSGYPSWAGIYGLFFCVLMYTMMYLTVVQQAFNFIVLLPDKVLRWIGGQTETLGAESLRWSDQAQKTMEGAGEKTQGAVAATGEQAKSMLEKKFSKSGQTNVGGGSTPP